jgi:fumarate reductase flavoprotein subunit
MHNVPPNSGSFIAHLGRAARRAGVEIRTVTKATALTTEARRVTGITCKTVEGQVSVSARAVVLAAGDFTSDPDLKARYMGPREAMVDGVNAAATGDGQKLALAIGARVLNGGSYRHSGRPCCSSCHRGLCSPIRWHGRSITCRLFCCGLS